MRPFYILALLSLSTIGLAQRINPTPVFSEPALDPTSKEIAFVSGGDIWTVPIGGGEARLLVAHEGFESRPLFAPDGRSIAFTSTRSGNGDVYIFDFSTGIARRITFEDTFEEVSSWSPDSKFIYFSSTANDISGMNDVYRVSRAGGTPMPVLDEAYTNEFFAASSPDGKSLAYNARGISSRQWWRNGHSHLDESEIWIQPIGGSSQQVTKRGAKDLWPMWSKDGQTLFYVSDRSGKENIWKSSLNGTSEQLTKFQDGRVVWPSISLDGNTIVFERNFSIWKYDVSSGKTEQVQIAKRGLASTPAPEHQNLNNQFEEMTLSADGKKVAFVVRGEVFATSAKDGGNAVRISNTIEEESTPIWSPNSKLLVYVSESKGSSDLVQYDFMARTTKALTQGPDNDFDPAFSNDGKFIAFARNGKELRILDLATGKDRFVCKMLGRMGPFSFSSSAIKWSSDNQWIAFTSYGNKVLKNLHVVNVKTGEVHQVTFLPHTFSGSVAWGKDGKYLLFNTWQRTENAQVARVDLIPRTPYFPESRFEELFTDPTEVKPLPPAPGTKNPQPKDTLTEKKNTAVRIDFKNIHQRLSLLPVGIDAAEISISHDGTMMLFIGTVAGQQNLYTFSLDESAKEAAVAKQITTTAGAKSSAQFTSDDKEIIYLEQGKINRVTIESRQVKPLDVTAEMDMVFADYKVAVGQQAWKIQHDYFYDSAFHGVDWMGVRGRYMPYIAGSQTSDEMRRVISFMVGELNASHSGISGLPNTEVVAGGKLGLKFDAAEYERTGKLKIKSIIDLSPASVVGTVKPGDFVIAVDDTLIKPNMNIDQLLQYKINKRISLTLNSTGNSKDDRKVYLRPVNLTTDKRLRYRHWVNQQREYVNKISNGRLGYVHLFDMTLESLNQLYVDLDADNQSREGVVVDVRNNNGGFVNAYALDVLSRQGYMTMTPRGLPSAPARTMLGQRSLEARTVLVTNQHTLSDGEDFTEGYKTMKLGTVVGEPTAGWIVFTSGMTLLDGSIMRLPFIKITDNKGANMELAPRTVDLPVTRSMGESAKGIDTQLDAAVSTLLKQLDTKSGMD